MACLLLSPSLEARGGEKRASLSPAQHLSKQFLLSSFPFGKKWTAVHFLLSRSRKRKKKIKTGKPKGKDREKGKRKKKKSFSTRWLWARTRSWERRRAASERCAFERLV
jgi:hypothetical protein